jgi:Domain of unknown function (DUF4173)
MQDNSAQSASTTTVWLAACAASALGAVILFDAWPGVNWGIWVAAASAGLILARVGSRKRVTVPVLILLGWAMLLAFGLAVTANGFIQFLIVISDAMLLGLAVIVTGTEEWSSLSATLLPAVPFLAPFRVWLASVREASSAPRSISSPRAKPIVKGVLLTLPIAIALVALLRDADPVFAWTSDHLTALLPDWSISTRVLFFLFLLSLTLGANSLSARESEARLPALPGMTEPSTLGITEQRIVLWSVAVILWVFVLLQVSYLFHSPPSAIGSGVTFAEYARKGFAELSLAVTIVGGIILVLEVTRPRDTNQRMRSSLVSLEAALLIALELVLLSAFRRVILYEQAYGFTTARLFAQAYMVMTGTALIALWLEIGRESISVAFARRLAVIALAVFTVMVFWNYEAWIVNRNIDRSHISGKFDAYYALRLSRDAMPTLIDRRSELPTAEQSIVEGWLGCTQPPAHRRWFEWNRSVVATMRAMAGLKRVPCSETARVYRRRSAD